MSQFGQRQGFLVSAIIHLAMLMILISHPPEVRPPGTQELVLPDRAGRVFLPSQADLRRLLGVLPPPRPVPPPLATPSPGPPKPRATPSPRRPDDPKFDRVSVGSPSPWQERSPLLTRDMDLTKSRLGRADGIPGGEEALKSAPVQASPESSSGPVDGRGREDASRRQASGVADPRPSPSPGPQGDSGLPLRAGTGSWAMPRGSDGSRGPLPPGALAKLVDRSAARLVERDPDFGSPEGSPKQLGPFHFDPQGADFTVWINHGKNEIYRNWMLPRSVMLGFSGGTVVYELTVERDGTMSSITLLRSSGTPALDRSARHGLTGALWLPLPDDYRPSRLTLRIAFLYGNGPRDL